MSTARRLLITALLGFSAATSVAADDVDRLVEYLGNQDKDLRIAAIEQLAELKGDAVQKAIPHLVKAMENAESGLAAAKALKKLGALNELKSARDKAAQPARKFAAIALGDELEPAAVPEGAERKPVPNREEVPPETRRVIEQLIEKIGDKDPLVRTEALIELAKLGTAAKAVDPAVGRKILEVFRLKSGRLEIFYRLYYAAQAALISLDCVEEASTALRDSQNYSADPILVSLAMMGPRAKSSLPDIKMYAKHRNLDLRVTARCAIAFIDNASPAAILDLLPLLKDQEVLKQERLVIDLLKCVNTIGPRAKALAPAVIAILDPDNPRTDSACFVVACWALHSLHTNESLQALQRAQMVVRQRIRENLLGSPNQLDLDFTNWYVIEVEKAPGTEGAAQRQGSPYARSVNSGQSEAQERSQIKSEGAFALSKTKNASNQDETVSIGIRKKEFCIPCTGTGKVTCDRCRGKGQIERFIQLGTKEGGEDRILDCPDCLGKKLVTCKPCRGEGRK